MNCPAGLFCFLLFTTRFRTRAFTRPSPATPESGAKPDAFIGRLRNLSGVPDSRSRTASETQFVLLGISRQLLCFRVLRRKGSCGTGRARAGQFVPGFLAASSRFRGAKARKMALVRIKPGTPVLGRFGTLFGKVQDFMQDNLKPFCRTNPGFTPCRRKTDFAKCKILGQFCVVSSKVSTICIVLAENIVVLRVPIQNKGEPKK